MFSIFNAPASTVHHQQENNITARKPGLSTSTRKPFAERKPNTNLDKESIAESKPVKAVNKPEFDMSDLYICSYEDTPENYADIQGSRENISSILFGNIPKTPPRPKNTDFAEPDLIEDIEKIDLFDDYFESIFYNIKLTNTLKNDQFNDNKMFDFPDFDTSRI